MIQTMPATTLSCYSCGRQGHMKRECPLGGSYGTRGRAAPATMGRGRGGYPPRAAHQPPRNFERSRLTCFKCLNKGHSVRECQILDNKLEAIRQRNLAKLTNTGGPPGEAVHSVQEEEYSGPAAYPSKMVEVQQAFEKLNQEGSDFQ